MSKFWRSRGIVMDIFDALWATAIVIGAILTAANGRWITALLSLVGGLAIVWVFRDHDRLKDAEAARKSDQA